VIQETFLGVLEEMMKTDNGSFPAFLSPRFVAHSFACFALALLGLALLCNPALAQRSGSGGNTPSRGSTAPKTPSPSDLSIQPTFIIGKVMMDGGEALPEPVAIERLCNGSVRREGYTDFKGHFQIQLGSNFGFQDASENDPRSSTAQLPRPSVQSGNRSPMNLTGCEFRAVLAGFQSSTVMLRSVSDGFQTEVGTIILKRMGDAKGTTVSLTSMAAPKDAKQAFEKGRKALSEDKFDEAVKQLDKATEKYPQFAAAWSLLGDIHQQHEQFDKAGEEYKKALAADPQYVNPLYGLALIAAQEKKWQDVADYTGQVINLNAYAFPSAYFYNAAANYNVGKFDVAEVSARKYKAGGDRKHPEVSLLLGSILARKEDYSAAAQQLRDYLAMVPTAANANELQARISQYDQLSLAKK
jgi:tetratricopeptide (TPR) repeat protein